MSVSGFTALTRAPAWKPGQSGNPGGKPKAWKVVRRAFQRALMGSDEYPSSVAQKIIQHALDDDSPKQEAAWKIMLAYGIGMPEKALDQATTVKLAEEMIKQMIEQARAAKAEAAAKANAAIDATVETEPSK